MSPRARRTAPVVAPVEDDDNTNDYVMARLAAGRASLQAALAGIDDILGHFADPGDDLKGKERTEALTIVLEMLGAATRSLECAEQELEDVDFELGEPWEDEQESS